MSGIIEEARLAEFDSNADDKKLDETCGIELRCYPFLNKRIPIPFLQRFATVKWALTFFCIGGFIQGFIVNGLFPSVISTLEKRFSLTSTESGLIASFYEIASTIVVLFITYVGGKGHKPLWVGWGIFLIGVSGIIFSLPYFLAPPYTFVEGAVKGCGLGQDETCQQSGLRNYRFIFYLALFVAGAGSTPLYSLGVVYLDENVEQQYSALYGGIFVMVALFGPGVGYVAGGVFLSIYTHPYAEVSITESSYQWVGAWWLGSLLISFIGIVSSFPTLLLPKVIPGTERNRLERETEVHQNDKGKPTDDFGKKFVDLPKCVLLLLHNPTYVFLTAAVTLDSLIIGGVAVFGPKFMEVQFGIDSSTAGTYFGLLTIVGGAGGQFIGGALISKYNIKMKSMLHICYLSPFICFFFCFNFLITCANQPFAGVVSPYFGQRSTTGGKYQLESPCNKNCSCSDSDFSPVCGDDGVTYFSPCYAACQGQIENSTYIDCLCLPADGLSKQTAVEDVCIHEECSSGGQLIGFCICMFGVMFFTFTNEAAAVQASMRCVAFNKRSFSLGLQIFFLRLLGTLPGPLVVGFILDLVCIRWANDCGNVGSCLAYDKKKLALLLFLFVGVGKLLDSIIYLFAYLVYKQRSHESTISLSTTTISSRSQSYSSS